MKINSLPTNYDSPSKMIIGTNKINNVKALVAFNDFTPILIGDGEIPHIWLNIPANREGSEWYPLVKDNFSTNPNVIVIKTSNGVKVTTPEGIVVECVKQSNGTLQVKKLDLRPFGLNITSDSKSMTVMGTSISSSTFSNMGVVVGLGGGA
jgi:hypothetical protein